MFGQPNVVFIFEFNEISLFKNKCLPFFRISQSKEVGLNPQLYISVHY
jgi:hypothetical protein